MVFVTTGVFKLQLLHCSRCSN